VLGTIITSLYRDVTFMPDGETLVGLTDRSGEFEWATLPATGEAGCELGAEVTLGILALLDQEHIPVACGEEIPDDAHEWPALFLSAQENLRFSLPAPTATLSALDAPDLIAVAGRVIVETDRRLVPLFARSFPDAVIHGTNLFKGDQPVVVENFDWLKEYPDPDYFVFLGSLPRFFRSTLESFPETGARLRADPGLMDRWRERLYAGGPGLKIGISWRSLYMSDETARYSSRAFFSSFLFASASV